MREPGGGTDRKPSGNRREIGAKAGGATRGIERGGRSKRGESGGPAGSERGEGGALRSKSARTQAG